MRNQVNAKWLARIVVVVMMLSLTACGACAAEPLSLSATDYADALNWLSLGGDESKAVDVFMVYPTLTASPEAADRPFVRLDSAMMRDAAGSWLLATSGVIADSANIYAPFYRQLNGLELDSLTSDTFASSTNSTPRDDVFAAFAHYLIHINKGQRPFLLLGCSQGAQLVLELATTFLGSDEYAAYNANHIITYAIGCPVSAAQIAANPHLKFSESATDTGALVSWNTIAPSEIATGAYTEFGTWRDAALITNPISWRTDEVLAHASDNLASMVIAPDYTIEMRTAYANAIVDKEHSALLVTTVDESAFPVDSVKISKYHRHDLSFFHDSIKQNIKDRIAAFSAR